jgi:hypothetical protein
MSDAAKRAEVADMYPGPRWKKRVANMTDAQVYAIWARQQEKLSTQEEDKKDEADPPWPF